MEGSGVVPKALRHCSKQQTLTIAIERAVSIDAKGVRLARVDPYVHTLIDVDTAVIVVPKIASAADQTAFRTSRTARVLTRLIARLTDQAFVCAVCLCEELFAALIAVETRISRIAHTFTGAVTRAITSTIAATTAHIVWKAHTWPTVWPVMAFSTARLHLIQTQVVVKRLVL